MGLYDRDYMRAGRAARPSLRVSRVDPVRPSRSRLARSHPRGPLAWLGSVIFWGGALTIGFIAARYLWSALVG